MGRDTADPMPDEHKDTCFKNVKAVGYGDEPGHVDHLDQWGLRSIWIISLLLMLPKILAVMCTPRTVSNTFVNEHGAYKSNTEVLD